MFSLEYVGKIHFKEDIDEQQDQCAKDSKQTCARRNLKRQLRGKQVFTLEKVLDILKEHALGVGIKTEALVHEPCKRVRTLAHVRASRSDIVGVLVIAKEHVNLSEPGSEA